MLDASLKQGTTALTYLLMTSTMLHNL